MRTIIVALLSPIIAFSLKAQSVPPSSVNIGFGIDTTVTDVGNIVALTRAYLAHPDSSAPNRGLWSTKSEFDRRLGDITIQAYQGFPATIVSIVSNEVNDSVYVVKILYANSGNERKGVMPLALQRRGKTRRL